jgi:nucleotide-binding universal stress UspA family protein
MPERAIVAKRVLIAVNLEAPASWAVDYAIRLAGRLGASLTLMAVDQGAPRGHRTGRRRPEGLDDSQRAWLDRVVSQCPREGVSLEIFFSSGQFFEEIMRFVRSQPGIQFIVLGLPREGPGPAHRAFFTGLKPLNRVFTGEILLVREQGKVTSMSEINA